MRMLSGARKRHLSTVSLLAGMSVLGWMGAAHADYSSCYVCGGYDPNTRTTQICCQTAGGSGPGSGGGGVMSMNYYESFDYYWPNGWVSWENCATDSDWYAIQYYDANDNPPPGGGSYAMRLHTGGLNQSCAYPGMYAHSPSSDALPNYHYTFSAYTRNASNSVLMTALFFDSNGALLEVVDMPVSADSWQYHVSSMELAAPANTAFTQIRFGLLTPNEYTDVDSVGIVQSNP